MNLMDFLKGKQNCYIYGAGVVGYYAVNMNDDRSKL